MIRKLRESTWAIAAVVAVATAAPVAAQQVIRMQEITIEGEVQKPQASYILQRSGKVDLGVDVRSFRPKMADDYKDALDQHPELFRTDLR